MGVLVLAEHDNKSLKSATLHAVTAAAKIDPNVTVLVAGQGAKPAAEAAAKVKGVAKVVLAEGAQFEHALAEPLAALLVQLAPGYSHLLAPATTSGKNVMPRVAALLDVADRVLHGRVRELHHVRALRRLQPEPACQVRVQDVEAAGAEPEEARLLVDEDVVALLDLARELGVRDARDPVDLEPHEPVEALRHRRDAPAPKGERQSAPPRRARA